MQKQSKREIDKILKEIILLGFPKDEEFRKFRKLGTMDTYKYTEKGKLHEIPLVSYELLTRVLDQECLYKYNLIEGSGQVRNKSVTILGDRESRTYYWVRHGDYFN